jgi:hypothetical protein
VWIGSSPAVFIGLTVLLFGGAAFRTGQSLAEDWRPAWLAIVAALALGVADRGLTAALFDAPLLSTAPAAVASLYLVLVAVLGWRLTLAHKMVRQYPWLYTPAGPLSWRVRDTAN